MKAIPIEAVSPYWPLPGDYFDLTNDGKRRARANAVAMWTLGGPGLLCTSVNFFEDYYLRRDPQDDEFDPLYFRKGWLPKSHAHWKMIGMWAQAPQSIAVCPRGFAKSVNLEETTMVEMLTVPGWSVRYATNTHPNARERGENIREQLYNNSRINDDFAPCYNAKQLRPGRWGGSQGLDYFKLVNKAGIRFMSSEGYLRGGRPNVYNLDDIENDESSSTGMERLRSYAEELIFKVVLPSTMEAGCKVRVVATFVSKQHYAYAMMATRRMPDGSIVAEDERFDLWDRMLVDAQYTGKDGKERSIWPAMWPLTEAEVDAMMIADPKRKRPNSLEMIARRVGERVYLSEYRARPGERSGAFFKMDGEAHGYTIEGADDALYDEPRESKAVVVYSHGGVVRRESLRDMLLRSRMALAGDTSNTHSPTSDFKALVLQTLTADNILFILDAWAMRVSEDRLIAQTIAMAARWKAPVAYCDAVLRGYSYYNGLRTLIATRSSDAFNVKHMPMVKRLPNQLMSKTGKITGLRFRFDHGLIKFPLYLRGRNKVFSAMFEQIESFNPDAKDGGLQNDDLLDMVAQSSTIYADRGRPNKFEEFGDPRQVDVIGMLRRGQTHDDEGLSLTAAIGLENLPKDVAMDLLRRAHYPGAGRAAKEGTYCDDSKA